MPVQIRDASPFDIPFIIEMLKNYRSNMQNSMFDDADDSEYITNMLSRLMAGNGVVLVSEDKSITGMLIAGIMPSIWSPKHLLLTEFAYWVEPEFRGGTSAYRLLKEYQSRCKELKSNGRVHFCVMSKMINSPDLKYDRFGFQKLEEFWVM